MAHDSLLPRTIAPLTVPRAAGASFVKANALIHSYALSGEYTHLARRVFNLLAQRTQMHWRTLSGAEREQVLALRRVLQYEARVGELHLALGLSANNHNTNRVYEAVDRLYQLEFAWNVREDGALAQVKSRLVSQWTRVAGGLRWEYPPDVFRFVIAPQPYTVLDLHLANGLSSTAALALYENTCRYVNNPSQLTAQLPVASWVALLSGPGRYPQYKDFKRYVLRPALAELAASEACPLAVELLETKAARGQVTHLQFRVTLKKTAAVPTERGLDPDPQLGARLRAWGVSEQTFSELLSSYPLEYLQAKVQLTEQGLAEGRVKSAAAYLMAAVREDYLPTEQAQAREARQRKAWETQRQAVQEQAAALDHGLAVSTGLWVHQLDAERKAALLAQFGQTDEVRNNRQLAQNLNAQGLESAFVEKSFLSWVRAQPELRQEIESFDPAVQMPGLARLVEAPVQKEEIVENQSDAGNS